jgi:NAD(P)-dependent dehydrogenase (short-subunit alcohol dehydrogenase family)
MSSNAGVAVVTGGGTGIGRAASLALAGEGFSVVLAGRREAKLDAVRTAIEEAGGSAHSVVTDVTDEASVVRLFAEVKATYGRLDVLFNNAGIFAPQVPFEDLGFTEWSAVVATNLTGSFLCAREAFRMMKDQDPQGGRIINNGSISAFTPRPKSAAYTATKHAITGLTKSLSLDGRRYNIACGQIDIGNAAAGLATRLGAGSEQADGSVRPEPMMDVADVGAAVVLMARLPLGSNIQSMTIMATAMPFVGRG